MIAPEVSPAEFDDAFRRGVELWNAHRWFECHDELESLWKRVKHEKKSEPARDPRRDVVHGVLLLAVAYHHWSRGNRIGLQRKLEEGRRLLERSPSTPSKLNLAPFVIEACTDLDRGVRGGEYDPARVPRISWR